MQHARRSVENNTSKVGHELQSSEPGLQIAVPVTLHLSQHFSLVVPVPLQTWAVSLASHSEMLDLRVE